MSGSAEAKAKWQKANRQGRGGSDYAMTRTELLEARGYDLKKKRKKK